MIALLALVLLLAAFAVYGGLAISPFLWIILVVILLLALLSYDRRW